MLKYLHKYGTFFVDILGLRDESSQASGGLEEGLMEVVLKIRQNAKDSKDYHTSDLIRSELQKLNIAVKDTKEGTEWLVKD